MQIVVEEFNPQGIAAWCALLCIHLSTQHSRRHIIMDVKVQENYGKALESRALAGGDGITILVGSRLGVPNFM